MNQPFFLWCAGLAATSQFKEVTLPLRKLLEDTFSGWVQSRVVEKANKVLRECEKTNNFNKASGLAARMPLLPASCVQ